MRELLSTFLKYWRVLRAVPVEDHRQTAWAKPKIGHAIRKYVDVGDRNAQKRRVFLAYFFWLIATAKWVLPSSFFLSAPPLLEQI